MRELAVQLPQNVAGLDGPRRSTTTSHGRLTQRIASLRPKRRRLRRMLRKLWKLATA